MGNVQKLFTSLTGANAATYIGAPGRMFYDESTGSLRLGDGITTGGGAFSVGYGLSGNAVLAAHSYHVLSTGSAIATVAASDMMVNYITSGFSTAVTITPASGPGTNGVPFEIRGFIDVTTGGTVIPQITLSTAPTGPTTQAQSTMRISPVGQPGANTSIGTWT